MVIKAKIIIKDIRGGENRAHHLVSNSCCVTFEFENQNSVTLTIPKKIYDKMSIGSTGELEYIGKNFKKFTVNNA